MAGGSFRSSMLRFNGDHFADPLLDVASLYAPTNHLDALELAEYLYLIVGEFRQANERIISFFLTELEIGGTSEDEKEKYEDYLDKKLNVLGVLQDGLRNRRCYGSAMLSLVVPFKRFLRCPKCGSQYPLHVIYDEPEFRFTFRGYKFHVSCRKQDCPNHGRSEPWELHDEIDDRPEKLIVKNWNPKEMRILQDPYTGHEAFLWHIPEDYKRQIREGTLFHLERVPEPVLKAIQHDQLFRFHEGVIFHMREPLLAGIKSRGWGVAPSLMNWRHIFNLLVLRRQNEAIGLDFVVPFRLITPAPKGGSAVAGGMPNDPLMTANMGDFMGGMRRLIRRHRQNPAGWHTFAYPVEYQALGGDATQLAPSELIEESKSSLFDATGVPIELYRGSLQVQSVPTSVRLFSATWQHLVRDADAFLRWLVEQVSRVLSWDEVPISLKKVTLADDIERQMMILQLMMGQQVSLHTGLKVLGLKFKDEELFKSEEARQMAETQARIQEEMDQAGAAASVAKGQPAGGAPAPGGAAPAGAAPAGGDPAAAGGDPLAGLLSSVQQPMSPQEMLQQADETAQSLLGMPYAQRRQALARLDQANEAMHDLVAKKLEKIRGDASAQGQQMVMSQQFGPGAAA